MYRVKSFGPRMVIVVKTLLFFHISSTIWSNVISRSPSPMFTHIKSLMDNSWVEFDKGAIIDEVCVCFAIRLQYQVSIICINHINSFWVISGSNHLPARIPTSLIGILNSLRLISQLKPYFWFPVIQSGRRILRAVQVQAAHCRFQERQHN